MALLSYDIRVVGLQAVHRALRSVERRVAALNRRQARGLGGPGVRGSGRRGGGSMAAEVAAQRRVGQQLVAAERRTQAQLRQVQQRGNRQRIADARRAARQEARVRAKEARRGARRGGGALRGRTMGRVGQSMRSSLRGVGTMGAGLLAIGGGFALSGAISAEKQLQATAAALANQARGTAGGGGKSFTQLKGEALKAARTEGLKSGQGPEAVIGGMRQFQAITGRFDIGAKMAGYMTELADATDAGLGDVGRTAGQIFQSIAKGGMDANKAMDATIKIMDAMAAQTKIGSIEMQDLAQEMGKLMSATDNFGGDISELAAQMGAIGQTAIAGGASSPAEAMTALMNFSADLIQRGAASPVYKKLGVDVFNRETITGGKTRFSLKAPTEIIKQIVGATRGDIATVQSMFGKRGMKAVAPYAKIYREAELAKPGTGMKAIEDQFNMFLGLSKTFREQRPEMAANRRKQADRQFDMAMQKFNDAIGQELLPVITKLIPKFVELIPLLTQGAEALGRFIGWFAENPIKGIGTIIGLAAAKQIAISLAADKLKSLLTPGGGVPGAVVPAGKKGSPLVAAGTASFAAKAAGLVGMALTMKGGAEDPAKYQYASALERFRQKGASAFEEEFMGREITGAPSTWFERTNRAVALKQARAAEEAGGGTPEQKATLMHSEQRVSRLVDMMYGTPEAQKYAREYKQQGSGGYVPYAETEKGQIQMEGVEALVVKSQDASQELVGFAQSAKNASSALEAMRANMSQSAFAGPSRGPGPTGPR
jgi:hypothetical protein